jgi:hypothetical protein
MTTVTAPATHEALLPGVTDPPAPACLTPQLDTACASNVAAAFLDARSRPGDARAIAAYAQLQSQSDRMFVVLTTPGRGVLVRFTRCGAPYRNDRELIGAVKSTRILEVTSAATDPERRHPLLGGGMGGAYDRFRAVHDLFGHVARGNGFDQEGEYQAWRTQTLLYSGLARWALATELHGENSVLCGTGQLAEHKSVLLPADLLVRSWSGRPSTECTQRTERPGAGAQP